MFHIMSAQVTPAMRALFRTDEPQARRCFGVLEGRPPAGKIFVDDLTDPGWAVVQEPFDHSLYFGGRVDGPVLAQAVAALQQEGEVLVGLWPDDHRLGLLPPDPVYDGRTLEFYDRPLGQGLERYLRQPPADCTLRRMDRDLVLRTEWGPGDVALMGGLDAWDQHCVGYCLVRGDEVLSEASVGPPALGLYEPGVFTRADQRGQGYGTLVVAHLIQAIEALGGQTYWNCAKQNTASAAIARKLGYRVEKEYRCLAWGRAVTGALPPR